MSDVSLEKRLDNIARVDKARLWVSMVDLKRELRVSAEKILGEHYGELLAELEDQKHPIADDVELYNVDYEDVLVAIDRFIQALKKELVEPGDTLKKPSVARQ